MDASISRALMGDSLAFHLLFVILATGLPVMAVGMELLSLLKRSPRATQLAQLWSRVQAVVFGFMVLSTMIIALQFKLFWPGFVEYFRTPLLTSISLAAAVISLEAIFILVYWRSWRAQTYWLHWLVGLAIAGFGIMYVAVVTSVNALMNTPTGFNVVAGRPTNFNRLDMLFNPAMPNYVSHSVMGYILATASILLAIYAWQFRQQPAARLWLGRLLAGLAGLVVALALVVVLLGDRSARFMAKYEPHKFAAAEGVMTTTQRAPLLIGGLPTNGGIKYGLKIPVLLSLLTGHNINTQVVGLEEFPVHSRPSFIIHTFFDLMVLCGSLLVVLPGVFLLLLWRRPGHAYSSWVLWALCVCGGLGPLAAISGWVVTELGRQPYIVQGYLRVDEALTTNSVVIHFGWLLPLVYLGLLGLCGVVLLRIIRPHHAPV